MKLKFVLFITIQIFLNNNYFSQSEDIENEVPNPWSISMSFSHMNFAVPRTGDFLSSSINLGYAMKKTSLSAWTGISVKAANGDLFPYFGVSASQPLIKWVFRNKYYSNIILNNVGGSISINEAVTCFYLPSWDYFLNITLNPSFYFKSFYLTSWIGYANDLEKLKSYLTFGFSVTKTFHSW